MEFVPPRKVFQQAPMNARKRHELGTYDLPDFLHPGRSANGGMLSYFQGHAYPRKGFVFAEGVMAVNKAKRVTLALFKPLADIKKGLRGFMESYLANYNRLVQSLYEDYDRIPYLHYEYYCEFSKSVFNFSFLFLKKLGFSFDTSFKTALNIATIFEYDDAYRVRPQDILSESSKEQLLKNPRKEIARLLPIYLDREPAFYGNEDSEYHAGARIVKVVKMFSYLLWLPPVKKAFVFALTGINFAWLQYDDIDSYWSLARNDFKIKGRSFEDRKEEQLNIMTAYAKKMNPGKEVKRVENEDGSVNIMTI